MIPLSRIKTGNITKQIELQNVMAERHGIIEKGNNILTVLKKIWESFLGFFGRGKTYKMSIPNRTSNEKTPKNILTPRQRKARRRNELTMMTKKSQRLMR